MTEDHRSSSCGIVISPLELGIDQEGYEGAKKVAGTYQRGFRLEDEVDGGAEVDGLIDEIAELSA